MKIVSLHGRQVLDSRGNPTVACSIETEQGVFSAMVPSGASTGRFEALELRDKNKKLFCGKSVLKAVENIDGPIARKLAGNFVANQSAIDEKLMALDGTPTKSKLGANAILAVSMAVCRAGAAANEQELFEYIGELSQNKKFVLPVPQLNVMNGGRHAGLEHDVQEQMFFPKKAKSFAESIRMGTEAYHSLKKILHEKFGPSATLVGDEGGFVPPQLKTVTERLELMRSATESAGYSKEISFCLDCAASEFFEGGSYNLSGKKYAGSELADFYLSLSKDFPVFSIEDGFAEDDWPAWDHFTEKAGANLQIVGDDLLVTNADRILKAIGQKSCNALLLKLNQIGTVSESIAAFSLARKAGWKTIVSNRSGETEDAFIADLAVGLGCGQSKFGAPARSERTAKYNRLLEIEELLGEKSRFGFD